ncbi:MAG: RNA polymerase sigma factor [Planctomycetota bacterium]|jgi:RNA polymerase sigma-70 factor (ECF subfamily)
MTDAQANRVRRAAAGDTEAFADLISEHKGMVYNLALRILGDAHDAEDAFQDVFLTTFAQIGSFRGEAKFSTWLYRIALNRCRRLLSLRKRRGENVPPDNSVAAERTDADGIFDVREALGELPEKFRTAVVLHCMFNYTYDEAGGIMKVPSGTVKTYVHRGKRLLRHALGEKER